MSYGGELSGKRRHSVWTEQRPRLASVLAPARVEEPPARFPIVWSGRWRDRPTHLPVTHLPALTGAEEQAMAKELNGRTELGVMVTDRDGTTTTSDGQRVRELDAVSTTRKLDPNRYATKKTIAQGMLDVALLTANASQLRYVLQVGEQHEFYTLMVTLICLSIILQVLIGVLSLSLNLLRDCRMDQEDFARSANGINYTTLAFVFVITTTNVLISAFDVRPVGPLAVPAPPPAVTV